MDHWSPRRSPTPASPSGWCAWGSKTPTPTAARVPYLMRTYGLDAPALVAAIERLTGESFGITDADLDAVRIDAVHSAAKAEAL